MGAGHARDLNLRPTHQLATLPRWEAGPSPAGDPRNLATDKPGFFEEVKRRHVWRMAVAYVVAAWLVVQVATQVFPFFKIPDWGVRLVVILLAIGFPIAVVWAWIFEVTPEGIRRTAPAGSAEARPEHETRSVGRKLNAVIITVLMLAVALMGWRLLVLRRAPAPIVAKATATSAPVGSTNDAPETASATTNAAPLPASTAAIPEKSVAVLPFANESGKADEQFFSDGLSEDLITALSQFAGLKVISRNSAFQFRDSKDSSAKIGELLGVAHLLEGSIQREDNEVRITATLVNAGDGTVVWTQRYDKPYKNLFALQDAITNSVADALKAKLLTMNGAVVQSDRPPNGSLAAWTAYQQGKAYDALFTATSERHAIAAYQQAVALDPNYAVAYAGLSNAWVEFWSAGGATTGLTLDEIHANARSAIDAALKLDPNSSQVQHTHVYLLLTMDMSWAAAETAATRSLQLAPNDPSAQFWLGNTLATLGQNRRAVELVQQALASDPRHASWHTWLSVYLTALGRLDDAKREIGTAIELQPGATDYHEQLGVIEILSGDPKAALAVAQHEPDGVWREIALALALQVSPDHAAADAALAKLIKDHAGDAAYQIAEVYALRRDPVNMFKWLDRAWANRDSGVGYVLMDPFILRYRNDPRFAAYCKKVGLPATTDAVAMKL